MKDKLDIDKYIRDYTKLHDRAETGVTAFGTRYLDGAKKRAVAKRPAAKRRKA